MIHIIGDTRNRYETLSHDIGHYLQEEKVTTEEVVTVLALMLVKVCKYSKIPKETLHAYITKLWETKEPACYQTEGK